MTEVKTKRVSNQKPTIRQRKLAQIIVENSKLDKPLNKKAMLEKVGYTTNVAEVKANEIINSKGVQDELKVLGFTEENAMTVVSEIMLNKNYDPSARLKATDQVFKIKGSYAPEKSLTVKVNLSDDKQNKSNELIEGILRNTKNT